MIRRGPCKECSENVEISREQIDDIIQRLTVVRRKEQVDEHTRTERIAACMTCSAYGPGGTCIYCGCLVRVKAAFVGEQCPSPTGPKW